METGDRDGIVNMLTQVFLRADINLEAFADLIIAQSPFGMVIGPAEDQSDEDDANVVYGLLTVVPLSNDLDNPSKLSKELLDFLEKKSQKFALKEFRNAFDIAKTERTGLFINERMLNFPHQIVKPSFSSIRSDLAQLDKPYQKIVYVHKLRIAKQDAEVNVIKNEQTKSKKKMGKAEKKRLAISCLSNADIVFDNVEDEVLYKTDEGEAHFYDIPVHSEVDSSSKFHILIKDGKSYMPYRRVVIMNMKRFNAFLEQVINGDLQA
ncbi:hypothetical protein DICVIV_03297 [Dictyocaulus viviparus]|uniref:Uncharacterized protein n=1 Tax=Dictyocaulus viviparus TaxID=29172 RepID=A0A0D8Y2X8_DICVI|nr:hypothetical protein DICVIV_03297 [Dictyocaulus viviparus]